MPRRSTLPRPLDRRETADLLGSLRAWRDKAIAGLMLLCGLRSSEVLALEVVGVDVGARWLRITARAARNAACPWMWTWPG